MRPLAKIPATRQQTRSAEPVRSGGLVTNHLDHQIKTVLETPPDKIIRYQEDATRIIAPDASNGEPLSEHARHAMGVRFGFDFSRIRIHTDNEAAASLGAKAFTVAPHIFFRPGRGPGDRILLTHEIAHVVQQATGEATGVNGDESLRQALETRAVHASRSADHGTHESIRPLPCLSFPAPVLQFGFEEDVLSELHRLPSPTQEGLAEAEQRSALDIISRRRARLRPLFNAVSREDAQRYFERLRERRRGDILSERFHDILATPTRRELLHLLERKFNRPEEEAVTEPVEERQEEPEIETREYVECEAWTPVNDDTVQQIIDEALARANDDVLVAFGNVQNQRNTRENCCDLNYAAADHYFFMRDAVASGHLRPVWPIVIGIELPARVVTSSLPDDRFLRTNICPVSPPDVHVTQWGARGARDGEADYRERHPGSRPSPPRLPPDLVPGI